jgi:Flp pilus assembly protein TadB
MKRQKRQNTHMNAKSPARRRGQRQDLGTERSRRSSPRSLWRGLYGLSLLVAAAVVLLAPGSLVAVALWALLGGLLLTLGVAAALLVLLLRAKQKSTPPGHARVPRDARQH